MESLVSAKMVSRQPWYFGSGISKSCQTCKAGKDTRDLCTHDQNSCVCRTGPSVDSLLGKFPTQYPESQDTYQEIQRVVYMTLKSITEAASRLLLSQLSSTHQDGAPCHVDLTWHWLQEACYAGLRTWSTMLPTQLWRFCLLVQWRLLCSPCYFLHPWTETLGLGFVIPQFFCVRL